MKALYSILPNGRSMSEKCIKIFVSGRVQGVFFRESTKCQAVNLDITGHAINLPDGRVEVLACGDPDVLEQLVSWLRQGPELSHVEDLQVEDTQIKKPQSFVTY